jgi:Glycosyl hydrolases family 43
MATKTQSELVTPAAGFKQPLVKHIYTADPSAHVFDGRVYVYPSHDIETDVPESDLGDHFQMRDYHVLSMAAPGQPVTDHGVALALEDVPWADRQFWAPDAAFKNGDYYLVFPAKDKQGVFRIGFATSKHPAGPFTPHPEPIHGSFSIDPCVFIDDDGTTYMYFGGLWGGQLQGWQTGSYDASLRAPTTGPALSPKVGVLSDDFTRIVGGAKDLLIVDENGQPLQAADEDRRYFEGPWLHKHQGTYYFSYSTGSTHYLVYATSTSPLGPFTYRGRILNPVVGWTTHHSIVEFRGKWYLYYHDSILSGGRTHLRSVKVMELHYNMDGTIQTMDP